MEVEHSVRTTHAQDRDPMTFKGAFHSFLPRSPSTPPGLIGKTTNSSIRGPIFKASISSTTCFSKVRPIPLRLPPLAPRPPPSTTPRGSLRCQRKRPMLFAITLSRRLSFLWWRRRRKKLACKVERGHNKQVHAYSRTCFQKSVDGTFQKKHYAGNHATVLWRLVSRRLLMRSSSTSPRQ